MWRGYEYLLEIYYNACLREWIKRGYNNNMLFCVYSELDTNYKVDLEHIPKPIWFGNKSFYDSHKSMLLQKDYEYYKQFNWKVPLNLNYVWPN
jgi:hypothetical protein